MSLKDFENNLSQWLSPCDEFRVECDGMTRCISMLLQRQGIDHSIAFGSIDIAGNASQNVHYWIELRHKENPEQLLYIDMRARMWLGDDSESVPHGVFSDTQKTNYQKRDDIEPEKFTRSGLGNELMFFILSNTNLNDFPLFEIPGNHKRIKP